MKTYSSKPFVSHDGKDENGVRAEVKVVLGFGNVENIESSKNGNAKKVTFSVENTTYAITGWTRSDEVVKLVERAQESEEPIHFRIETRRKDNIDRTEPIADLSELSRAKDSIVKSLVAVKFDSEDWVYSADAVTNPKEDPKTGSGLYSANDMDDEELEGATKKSSGNIHHNSSTNEPPPYITFDRDGNLLPGSIAVSVPLNLFSYVKDWNRNHDDENSIEDSKIDIVVKALLSAANELQMKIKGTDKPDLSAGSHTRARAILFEVIRSFYPISPEIVASKKTIVEWRNNLIEKGLEMWKWAISETERVYGL